MIARQQNPIDQVNALGVSAAAEAMGLRPIGSNSYLSDRRTRRKDSVNGQSGFKAAGTAG